MNLASLFKLGKGSKLTPGGEKYLKSLSKLGETEVVVGLFAGPGYPEGQSVVEVAAKNELGTSEIPPRPFLKQMADNYGDKVTLACADMGKALADGASAQGELEKLGKLLEGMVKDEITYGKFTPNSPATIARKGSSHPLIDTGLMRQSIQSKVRPKTK